MKFFIKLIIFNIILLGLTSCSESNLEAKNIVEIPITKISGTGNIEFNEYASLADKPIKLFYHIPDKTTKNTKIVFVFHGNSRNAKDYRNAIIDKANELNFIAIIPEFSRDNFPTGDSYNLGNVFIDGDNPTTKTLNEEEKWTFSLIEPIFDFVKEKTENETDSYDVIGHSAGAQFALRFAMFKQNARFSKMIASASGWYTSVDFSITFPYGFKESPLENIDLAKLFSSKIIIQIGELDNDSNASALRRNNIVDKQGKSRFDRAYSFYEVSEILASKKNVPFAWKIVTNNGLNHDYIPAIQKAADLLFN